MATSENAYRTAVSCCHALLKSTGTRWLGAAVSFAALFCCQSCSNLTRLYSEVPFPSRLLPSNPPNLYPVFLLTRKYKFQQITSTAGSVLWMAWRMSSLSCTSSARKRYVPRFAFQVLSFCYSLQIVFVTELFRLMVFAEICFLVVAEIALFNFLKLFIVHISTPRHAP
jgi:hypothetical protein